MNTPFFITTEKQQSTLPLLIVDKQSSLSRGLISVLSEHFVTVLVSHKVPLPHLSRIVHVPFRRTIPAIPDNYFSAILLFYTGEKSLLDSLPSFVKKAKQNNAKLLFVTHASYAELPSITKARESYEHFHLVIYGDIFGISRSEDSLVTQMIHEAHQTKRIIVHGSGLSETYPVYYADVLQGILHVLLSHQPPKIGILFPSSGVTEIHLARLVLKHFPHADLSFAKSAEKKQGKPHTPEGTVLIEEPYPLSDKISHLQRSALQGPPESIRKRKKHGATRGKHLMIFIMTTGLCLALFSLSTFLFFLVGLFQLRSTVQAAKNGDLRSVEKRAESAKSLFLLAEDTSGMVFLTGSTLGFGKQADYYVQNIRSARLATNIALSLSDAGMTYKAISDASASNPEESMLRVSADIKRVILDISQLQVEKSLPQTYAKQLAQFKSPLIQASGIIDVLPQLTGVGREVRYLVLFQNNMELRAGGGFIGSYGILTLRDGKMQNFSIHDVYDADGQLTGHVDPPYYLRRYIGSSHLFLRDSNFDVEFGQNAAMAASLLQASTGDAVDGVVTMDVSFLRTLLEEIGPVYVPAYDETVSAKNFYIMAQTKAENNFFPGSNQKQDFLQHVAKALILSLEDRDQLPYVGLLEAMQQGLSQKHIMVTSADHRLKTLLEKNGFAPSITKLATEKAASINDFLGVFESNVGLNKGNYYIKRAIQQDITLRSSGEREGVIRLRYNNFSTDTSPFGGEYKVYIQLVLAEDTRIDSISINGVPQQIQLPILSERVYTSVGFIPPQGIEVLEDARYGRSIFSFYTVVPVSSEQELLIRYTSVQENPLPDQFTYLLRVFKQPGTDFDPYKLTLTYDPSFTLLQSPDFANNNGGKLRVMNDLTEDIIIPLTFTR